MLLLNYAALDLQFLVLYFNPLNAKLNPICHLLTLLGAHPILHVSSIRFNILTHVKVLFK